MASAATDDPYRVLKVPRTATLDEIKRAIAYGRYMVKEMIGVVQLKKYRTMKKRYVPDD